MIGTLKVKDGVSFAVIAAGGFRILSALDQVSNAMRVDLTITSGCDGCHSGEHDPHHRGEAYDVRSHDFEVCDTKQKILTTVMSLLGSERFFGFLESEGTANEHFHFQVRKGTTYP